MVIKKYTQISDRGKRRLQIAANFLRQQGIRFDGENFYDEVIKAINRLGEVRKSEIKSMVDWVEDYESTEKVMYGVEPTPARSKKQKAVGRKWSATKRLPAQKHTSKGIQNG